MAKPPPIPRQALPLKLPAKPPAGMPSSRLGRDKGLPETMAEAARHTPSIRRR